MASSIVAKNRHVVSNLLTTRSSMATVTRGFVTKNHFYGLVVKCVRKVLLNRIPHTLCRYESDDGKIIGLSLNIPGIAKRIETDESESIIIDMKTQDGTKEDSTYSSAFMNARVNTIRNILFVKACLVNKENPPITKFYNTRINLRKRYKYDRLFPTIEDGKQTVTLQKLHHPPEENNK